MTELVATESKVKRKQRERTGELVIGFETGMFFQAFEENLTGILNNVRKIRDGEIDSYVEEATYKRYVEAKSTLKQMRLAVDTYETMLQIVEYDLLETTGTSN